jgi:hypothetical protein
MVEEESRYKRRSISPGNILSTINTWEAEPRSSNKSNLSSPDVPYFLYPESNLFETIRFQPSIYNITSKDPEETPRKRNFIIRSALIRFLHKSLNNRNCTIKKNDDLLKVPIKYKDNMSKFRSDFTNYFENEIKNGRYH